jgi:hypothetical protein
MSFFKKLGALFSAPNVDNRSFWLYVKCETCGEILKGRVDLYNDLSVQYKDSGSGVSYFCRKVFVGSNRCYKPIEVQLTFDKNRRLVSEEIKGGVTVSEEEFFASHPNS